MPESEEQKLSDQVSEERKGEASVTLSDSTSPEGLLDQAKAQDDLQRLQLRQVADLIPAFRTMLEETLRKVDQRIEALNKTLSEILKLRQLIIQDAETELEVLKVFQSELVILDKVEEAGTLAAAKPDSPKAKS